MKNFIKREVKKFVSSKFTNVDLLQNINLDICNNKQKKVLISYICQSYEEDLDGNNIFHSNYYEINQIVKYFINEGYSVDIINCNRVDLFEKILQKKYRVIFGLGKVFDKAKNYYKDAVKILYMTENRPNISEKMEKERVEYYKKRYGKNVKLNRSKKYYTEDSLRNIDHLIILGDIENFNDINVNKYYLCPTGLRNEKYKIKKRDIDNTKKNFLWFGSNGAIHKGLDILLDVFNKRKDINLFIFGVNRHDKKILSLKSKNNIKVYDKISVKSNEYIEIIEKCTFAILPSCSEATSTSILTSMRHGLIPIVSKNIGFEQYIDEKFVLKDYKIEYIEEKINELMNIDNEEIQKTHYLNFEKANNIFSIERYTEDLNKILNDIFRKGV